MYTDHINVTEIVNNELNKHIQELIKKYKIKDIDLISVRNVNFIDLDADEIETVKQKIDGLICKLQILKQVKRRIKFFQPRECAENNIYDAWDIYKRSLLDSDTKDNTRIEEKLKNKKVNKCALDVYKYVNAYIAMYDDINCFPEDIIRIVREVSSVCDDSGRFKYISSSGYFYDVEGFKELFEVLKKLAEYDKYVEGDIFEQLELVDKKCKN